MTSKIDDIINPINAIKKIESAISYLIKKWWLLAIAGIIGGGLGYLYSKKQRILYESHLTFSLDEGSNNSSGGGIASIAAQFGFGGVGENSSMFSGDNIMEILKSRRMIERVLLSNDTFDNKPVTLINFYMRLNKNDKANQQTISFPLTIEKNELNYAQDSILYKIYSDISDNEIQVSRPDKNLNIYELRFTSPDEKFTKIFTDRILQETIKFYTELKTKKSQETLNVLEQRVAALKGNLDTSISSKAFVQDANINPAFAAAQIPIQKQQFNIQVYGGAYGELYKNLELARYQFLQNIPLLQVIDGADYPMEKIKVNKIKYALIGSFIFIMIVIVAFSIKRIFEKRLHK